MYAYIKGTIEEKYEDYIVIENGGIGYNIMMPTAFIYELPELHGEAKIYTYTAVREDAFLLYGFTNKEALTLFKQLITVSGIGPKGGLAILSALSPMQIKMAILSGDSKLISTAPGIGKKTAERVIIDLKDKISNEQIAFSQDFVAGNISESIPMSKESDETIQALIALGYGMVEAKNAVSSAIKDGVSSEDANALLKASLRYM